MPNLVSGSSAIPTLSKMDCWVDKTWFTVEATGLRTKAVDDRGWTRLWKKKGFIEVSIRATRAVVDGAQRGHE